MPKVRFLKEAKEIEVPAGANLREEARKAHIEVYRGLNKYLNCMGHATCGTCRVYLKNDTMKNCSPKTFLEKIRIALSFFAIGHEDEVRLSCQVKVLGDIDVETTPELNLYGKPVKA